MCVPVSPTACYDGAGVLLSAIGTDIYGSAINSWGHEYCFIAVGTLSSYPYTHASGIYGTPVDSYPLISDFIACAG